MTHQITESQCQIDVKKRQKGIQRPRMSKREKERKKTFQIKLNKEVLIVIEKVVFNRVRKQYFDESLPLNICVVFSLYVCVCAPARSLMSTSNWMTVCKQIMNNYSHACFGTKTIQHSTLNTKYVSHSHGTPTSATPQS